MRWGFHASVRASRDSSKSHPVPPRATCELSRAIVVRRAPAPPAPAGARAFASASPTAAGYSPSARPPPQESSGTPTQLVRRPSRSSPDRSRLQASVLAPPHLVQPGASLDQPVRRSAEPKAPSPRARPASQASCAFPPRDRAGVEVAPRTPGRSRRLRRKGRSMRRARRRRRPAPISTADCRLSTCSEACSLGGELDDHPGARSGAAMAAIAAAAARAAEPAASSCSRPQLCRRVTRVLRAIRGRRSRSSR